MVTTTIDPLMYKSPNPSVDRTTDGIINSWKVPIGESTGFIQARVGFLHTSGSSYLAHAEDIISISTDQTGGKEEGDAVGKMTIILNNRNGQWDGKLIPHVTVVTSDILTERNVINSNGNLEVIQEVSPLFYGRVNELNTTNEKVTVECGDEAGQMDQSPDIDYSFWAEKSLEQKVKDIKDATWGPIDLKVVNKISSSNAIKVDTYVSSSLSSAAAVTSVTRNDGVNWAVPSDQIGRLLLIDDAYTVGTEDTDMTDFLLDPANNESIVGHCNVITVEYDSEESVTGPAAHIPMSTKGEVISENEDSIAVYGRIESPVYQFPNITKEHAQDIADNIKDTYASYKDRLITPTLVWKVPMLMSYIHYTLHHYIVRDLNGNEGNGIINWEDDISEEIHMKVIRKCVNYNSGGLTVNLECQRKEMIPSDTNPIIKDGNILGIQCITDILGNRNSQLFYFDPDTGIVYENEIANLTKEQRDEFFLNHVRIGDNNQWKPILVGGVQTPWGITIRDDDSGYGILSPVPTADVGSGLIC